MPAADRGQLTRLAILFGERKIVERADRLRLCSDHAGRYLTSMSLLTAAEAAELEHRLHHLTAEQVQGALARLVAGEEQRAAAAANRPSSTQVLPAPAAVVDEHADQLDLFTEG